MCLVDYSGLQNKERFIKFASTSEWSNSMNKKCNISADDLRKDPEAIGMFLAKDPEIDKYLEIVIRSKLWKWSITKDDLVSILYKSAFDVKDKNDKIIKKGWLSHDICDLYSYLKTTIRNMIFSKEDKKLKSFLKTEFGINMDVERHSVSLDDRPENGRRNDECVSSGVFELQAEKEDVKAFEMRKHEYLAQYKQVIEQIRTKNVAMAELLIRRMALDLDYRIIAEQFLREGLIPGYNHFEIIPEDVINRVSTSLSNSRYPTAYKKLISVALASGFNGLAQELKSRKRTKKQTI